MKQKRLGQDFVVHFVTYCVIGNGMLIIATTLINQLIINNGTLINDFIVSLPMLGGLTLVYLGTLLHRRKRAAWLIALPLYSFIFVSNILLFIRLDGLPPLLILSSLAFPFAVVVALVGCRREFTVKSDVRNFTISLRVAALIMAIALLYGMVGFLIMDKSDFGEEITVPLALHHTIDQMDFTTANELVPHTKRSVIFLDTLNILSICVLAYVLTSFFQPLRAKLANQRGGRELADQLLRQYSEDSEDFFKLWPQDKIYHVDPYGDAIMAYRVYRGVAMVAGDPIGESKHFDRLLSAFEQLCRDNDWLPALVDVRATNGPLYLSHGFQLQKVGQEAVVDVDNFVNNTLRQKYFREIHNRFNKHGYTYQLLQPPHNPEIMLRLHEISNYWLTAPGRQERGFMMGYYNETYLQQCPILVAKDNRGVIQGFINQLPTYRGKEANFDLLRHSGDALGNINDFMLISFIRQAGEQGYSHVNLGLALAAGIGKEQGDESASKVLDSTLRLLYHNGDRFFSFSGLYNFKAKYEPEWRDRFIAYKKGVPGFLRTSYALNRTLNKPK